MREIALVKAKGASTPGSSAVSRACSTRFAIWWLHHWGVCRYPWFGYYNQHQAHLSSCTTDIENHVVGRLCLVHYISNTRCFTTSSLTTTMQIFVETLTSYS